MDELKIKVGTEETTVEVLPTGRVGFNTGLGGGTLRKFVSAEDAALLVLHLAGKMPVFSDEAFLAVEKDVDEFRGRVIRDQKVNDLIRKLSRGYFDKYPSGLTSKEFELVRRLAEAETDVAEAEGKL